MALNTSDNLPERIEAMLMRRSLAVDEQVQILSEFWTRLGKELPTPTNEQLHRLDQEITKDPGKVILAAPEMETDALINLAKQAYGNFAGINKSIRHGNPVMRRNNGWAIDPLSYDVDYALPYKGGDLYRVRKGPDGVLLHGWRGWFNLMQSAGHIVTSKEEESKDWLAWVVAALDPTMNVTREVFTIPTALGKVEATETLGIVATNHLLHLAADRHPKLDASRKANKGRVDFVNDVIYFARDPGEPQPQGLGCVWWRGGIMHTYRHDENSLITSL